MGLKKIAEPDVTYVQEKPAASDSLDVLAALEREAAGNQQAQAAEQQQSQAKAEQQQADTLAADLLAALNMAAAVAEPGMWWLTPEKFGQLWGVPVRQQIAASGAEVMRRHGLSIGGLMAQYGPYIALAGALGPSVLGTMALYKAEKARLIEQQQQHPVAADVSST